MMKRNRLFLIVIMAIFSALLTACAFRSQEAAILYDLGPLPSSIAAQEQQVIPPDMPRVVVASVVAPGWLDNSMMYYRLIYSNDQETRFYTRARWNMPPAKLVRDRIQSNIASAGGTIMELRDIQPQDLMLRIELEDFSQHFDSVSQSTGVVALRVSLFQDRTLLSQKKFQYATPAPSPDAAGGARALAYASDRLMEEIMTWMINTSRQKRG